jgi:hypothetical protein
MSYLKVPIIARRFTTTAAGSMEVLNMDYEGPFPEDEYGNTYVLTIIDTFSRAVGLYLSRVMQPGCWYDTLAYLAVRVRLYLIEAHISRRIFSKS